MKLLLYSYFHPDSTDGASTSGRALVQCLRKRGVDMTVCLTDIGLTKKDLAAGSAEGLHIFHAWFSHPLELSPGLVLFIARNLQAFDVIHFRGVFSVGMVMGAYMAQMVGRPYVVSPLGNWTPSWKDRRLTSRGTRKYWFGKFFLKRALKGAARIICTSEMERDVTWRQIRTDKLTVIPNGFNSSAYVLPVPRSILRDKLGIADDREVFLSLGRLSKEKGLEFLLEVWQEISHARPEGLLVIAGGSDLAPEYGEHLHNRVTTMGLQGNVCFAGPVKADLKIALLQHSVCLLFPSFRESFGGVVLEALAAGTPVLASIGTPWRCLETDGLGWWLPWKKDLWVRAMVEAAERGPAMRQGFSECSRQWVADHFSWERTTDQYLEVYQEASPPSSSSVSSSPSHADTAPSS